LIAAPVQKRKKKEKKKKLDLLSQSNSQTIYLSSNSCSTDSVEIIKNRMD
jgi:hypothetical protein